MGTSKGYIAPKTVHWSQAKRAVTSYIKNGDGDSKAKAASKFASAMKYDIGASGSFVKASSNILSFVNAVSRGGVNQALRDFGRPDLIGKSADEVVNELINDFTNSGSTTEDYLSAEAITSALNELQIADIEQLKDVSCEDLLKEMLIEYTKFSFAFRYEEKIRMKRSPAETKKLLQEMDKHISNELHNKLDLSELKTVDFNNLNTSDVVEKYLIEAYEVFEMFYEEAE